MASPALPPPPASKLPRTLLQLRRRIFVTAKIEDKAPAAIVGLVGRKEYEQCAKDLYYFIQDIEAADWSDYVASFWPAVIKSALPWKGISSLLKSGTFLLCSAHFFLDCAYHRISSWWHKLMKLNRATQYIDHFIKKN